MSEMFRDCSISSAKLSVLLRVLLCGVDGGDEEPFEFSTHFKSAFVFIIATLDKQLKPILTFAAFLKRDLKPRDKIRSAMSIKSFTNICTDTCPATNKLVCQNTFFFGALNLVANFDNFKRKCFRFHNK